MQTISCSRCGHSFPMSGAFRIMGSDFCERCANDEWERRGKPKADEAAIEKLRDPTICVRCEFDNGSVALPLLAGLPACGTCDSLARNRPYPLWIRASFGVLLVLMVCSFLANLRFLQAYFEVARAVRRFQSLDVAGARTAAMAAAGHVPESPLLQGLSELYQGFSLLAAERSTEALPLLQRARRDLGDARVDEPILQAEMGAAFEAKDYDRFLDRARALRSLMPQDPMAEAGVASALACKFAISGDEAFRSDAVAHLEAAAKLPGANAPAFHAYEERIRRRLSTRRILSREDDLKLNGR